MVDFLTQKMKSLDFRLLKFWCCENLVDRFLKPFLKPQDFFGGKQQTPVKSWLKVHLGRSRGTCIDFPNKTRSELEVLAPKRGGQRNFGTPPKFRNSLSIASRWCKSKLLRGLENNLSLWLHRKVQVPGARPVSQRTIRRVPVVAHWGL